MYIDPGAGSLLFQVIAAGAVGLLASIGRLRRAIADFFAKLRILTTNVYGTIDRLGFTHSHRGLRDCRDESLAETRQTGLAFL